MRRLKIDLYDLEAAFDSSFGEVRHYLDTQTGEVLMVQDDSRRMLENLLEEIGPEADLKDALRDSDLPQWQKRALAEAQRVEEGYGTLVKAVPQPDSREAFRDMEAFATTVPDLQLREELQRALEGRGAFRRFKDVLGSSFRERERWFEFKRQRLRERMTDWLASLEIEPDWRMPPPQPPGPPVREQLLAAVLLFAQSASRLAGVERIDLLGSLTTPEPNPEDADLLVTVADNMDLAPLAKAARQLSARASQTGSSRCADVFLADPSGKYLGRTCPWKECGPGIRLSCDALHCGQRHFLHDDLRAITLQPALIQAPPVELWPGVVTRVPVPDDVEGCLLKPLRQSHE